MRPSIALTVLLAVGVNSSWFSSNSNSASQWTTWDQNELTNWLEEHNIKVPKGYTRDQLSDLVGANWYAGSEWSQKQVEAAKDQYKNLKEKSFDTWSESQLRTFLVQQGVVPPSGTREQLALLAKKQYWAYSSAVSSLSAAASSSISTAVYGDEAYQASKTASKALQTVASTASSASAAVHSIISDTYDSVQQTFDDTKDYVYSTWSDNELRTYLEENGAISTNFQASRDELLRKMKESYAAASDPIWKAWSDARLDDWLRTHGVIGTDFTEKRDKLVELAEKYYYDAKETVYTHWSDSELKDWLVEHDVIKSDAQLKREKLLRLVSDNYASAHSTVWGAWKDSDIRDWLIENGYLRSDAQVKRDELVKLINEKYTDVSASTASYLTWPDARLRAYLRAHGVDEVKLSGSRPSLLQEVRIRWVQANTRVESILQAIRDAIHTRVEHAEEQLSSILELITGTSESATEKGRAAREEAESVLSEKSKSASSATRDAKSGAASASGYLKGEL